MPALRRRLNYRVIVLSEGLPPESVGVLRKDGTYGYERWQGFVSLETAKE